MGALGFEYGYGVQAPETLVMWEAQFGDFVNAAQVTVDQFIVSGLAKWGETSRLTLLLPHGYEGAGPEHSSAREERFLTLAAEGNIRVANVSTTAQYFHLLRRQALVEKIRPLIVFTPKSLLRNQRSFSTVRELAEGSLRRVIDDPTAEGRREKVTRLLLCAGRIYYDITGSDRYAGNEQVAVARVELLYPFPRQEIVDLIASYPNLTEIIWVQEEPKNMGARRFMFTRNRERELVPDGVKIDYIGREYRASPGEGYPAAHRMEQERIVTRGADASTDRVTGFHLDPAPASASFLAGSGVRAGQHRVERPAQPFRVQGRVAVVTIRRAAVAQDAVGVDEEHVRGRLRAVGACHLLRGVVQIRHRPPAVLAHAALHRLEGVGRIPFRVVGADRQHAHAAVGIVTGDVGDPVVPRDRVRAVVAGEHDCGRPAAVRRQ